MKVVSFLAGCGDLDLGFEQAGFHVVWANEFEPSVHASYEKNHPYTILYKDYIQRLGFQPSGETYIGVDFDSSSKYKLKEVGLDKNKVILKERFAPYIITLGELIEKRYAIKIHRSICRVRRLSLCIK